MKVAVIGGGFSGLIFSLKLLEAGADVTLFEEHDTVGYPPHCTGLVSARTIALIGAPAFKSIMARFDRITLSNGRSSVNLRVRGGIYKVDRVKLENLMLEEAESRGLRVMLKTRVKRVSPRGIVEFGDEKVYDSIILADGYYGLLHRSLGLGYVNPPVYGVNVEYADSQAIDGVIVLFDNSISRGFFSWIIGLKDRTLAGLGVRRPRDLAKGLRLLERRLGLKRRLSAYGGPVIIGPPGERLSMGRVHVVGDGGGLNKPLTGGGLYPNSLAATLTIAMLREGLDVNIALSKSLNITSSMLRRQYKLAKHILEGDVVEPVIDVVAESMLGDLIGDVDYDHHEQLPLTILKRAPWEAIRVATRLTLSKPITLKYLIQAILP